MDLDDFVATLSRYARLIGVLVLTAGGVAFVIGQVLPRTYESEAVVLVGSLTETSPDQLLAYQRLAQTYAEIGTSATVMEHLITRLGLTEPAADLARRVDVRVSTGQAILRITARAPTGTAATSLADTLADEMTLLGKPATGPKPSLASVFQPATSPREPATPRILLNTVIGALLGLALGVGIAMFLGRTPGRRGSTVGFDEQPQWPT